MQKRPLLTTLAVIAAVFVLAVAAFAAYRLLSGRGLGIRSAISRAQTLLRQSSVKAGSSGQYTNVIFLHHSVGANLVEQSSLRADLTAAGLSFWDHGYNDPGLRDPQGSFTGYSYFIPGDNTDPDGLAALFAQARRSQPTNSLSALMQHEVIVVKSCFPTSAIGSDEQLAQDKQYYLAMRETMDKNPDRLLIILTQPPLHPQATNPQEAARARALADWLTSDEFLAGHANVAVFDLFDQLAEPDASAADFNMLRATYRPDANDSHPNQAANRAIGPQLASYIISITEAYRNP